MPRRQFTIEESEPLHGVFPSGQGVRAFDDNGDATAIANDHSGEEFLRGLCARHGISFETAMEIQMEVEEHLAESSDTGAATLGCHYGSRLQTMFVLMLKCDNARLALYAMAYALELDDIIGHVDAAGIGRLLGCSRYNVTKVIARFQETLSLPKRRGQKSSTACEKMSHARRSQLVPSRTTNRG